MLKEKIKMYSVSEISKQLEIPKVTLYRWINGEQISKHIKFIELLLYLDIDPSEYIKKIKNM